jgi:hypothetical protein
MMKRVELAYDGTSKITGKGGISKGADCSVVGQIANLTYIKAGLRWQTDPLPIASIAYALSRQKTLL